MKNKKRMNDEMRHTRAPAHAKGETPQLMRSRHIVLIL